MAQNIGIVTSLSWADPFKTNFEDGYKSIAGNMPTYAGKPSPVEAGGDYDSVGTTNKKLYRQMDKLNNVANIIVSVGGLVAAHPVVQKSTVPFIVLIGRVPDLSDFDLTDNDNYCGGVELHMVQDNINRRNALMSTFKITDPEKVFLLFNPNSRMGRFEAHEWRAQGGDAIAAALPASNDADEFAPAFKRLHKRGAMGVVVSSDPFFLSKQDELVTAANGAFATYGMTMCYPFDAFGAPTKPKPNSAISYGPDLTDAYKRMGAKAATIAAQLDKPQLPQFAGLDTLTVPAKPTTY